MRKLPQTFAPAAGAAGLVLAGPWSMHAGQWVAAILGRVGAAALLAVAAAGAAVAAGSTTLTAQYTIAISGITIGRVDVESRFTDREYAAAISGSTWGISRFVSDAQAQMAGAGRISGDRILPSSYNLDTSENGFDTRVRMAIRGGAVADVDAWPALMEAADRVPLTSRHRNGILDPIGAFLVALDSDRAPSGDKVCNRTVKVFDGWQRFDIRLSYSGTRAMTGGYTGEVMVCSARYVPIAGHRPSRESVEYMANNKRLEVWMAPVAGTRVMIPTRILIGTQVGDLIISARAFTTTSSQQARAE